MQVTTLPGAVAVAGHSRKTVDQIVREYEGDQISRDVYFVWELAGGKGHGHIPHESNERKVYFAAVRKHLQATYGLTRPEIAQLAHKYSMDSGGPARTNAFLRQRNA